MEEKKKTFSDFMTEYKREIVIGAIVVMAYRLGYKRGYDYSMNVVESTIKELTDALDVTKF